MYHSTAVDLVGSWNISFQTVEGDILTGRQWGVFTTIKMQFCRHARGSGVPPVDGRVSRSAELTQPEKWLFFIPSEFIDMGPHSWLNRQQKNTWAPPSLYWNYNNPCSAVLHGQIDKICSKTLSQNCKISQTALTAFV